MYYQPIYAYLAYECREQHYRSVVKYLSRLCNSTRNPSSKLFSMCTKGGLGRNMQGFHARYLEGQDTIFTSSTGSSVKNYKPREDVEIHNELCSMGLSRVEATDCLHHMGSTLLRALQDYDEAIDAYFGQDPLDPGGEVTLVEDTGSDTSYVLLHFAPDLEGTLVRDIRAVDKVGNDKHIGRIFSPLRQGDYTALLSKNNLRCDAYTSVLRLNKLHLAKLTKLYNKRVSPHESSTVQPKVFLNRLYTMLARYEALSGNSVGFQGALPDHVFKTLSTVLGTDTECFASPLNCYYPSYYSVYGDVDKYFGSCGSFFDNFHSIEGSYEANPPFVINTMDKMVDRFMELLEEAEDEGTALTFVTTLPLWTDAASYIRLASSEYTIAQIKLPSGRHSYINGGQHRADAYAWMAGADSVVFVLVSSVARARLLDEDADWEKKIYDSLTTLVTSNERRIAVLDN